MQGIDIYETFLIILYARNQYLGDILTNFVCEESIRIIFICALKSIKMKCYMFFYSLKIQLSEND